MSAEALSRVPTVTHERPRPGRTGVAALAAGFLVAGGAALLEALTCSVYPSSGVGHEA